jgi:hypothetical protein
MKPLAALSLIALLSSTHTVVAAGSLFPQRTPQIPPIRSEWQRLDWTAAIVQAKDYLKGFNITEKIALATGVGWKNGPSSYSRTPKRDARSHGIPFHQGRCIGNTPAIPNQNFPGLCLEDSPTAVRFADRVSIFPGGVTTAATWVVCILLVRMTCRELFSSGSTAVLCGPGAKP